jgi:hypothetical protein
LALPIKVDGSIPSILTAPLTIAPCIAVDTVLGMTEPLTEYQRGYQDGYAAYQKELLDKMAHTCPKALATALRGQELVEHYGMTVEAATKHAYNEERDE